MDRFTDYIVSSRRTLTVGSTKCGNTTTVLTAEQHVADGELLQEARNAETQLSTV